MAAIASSGLAARPTLRRAAPRGLLTETLAALAAAWRTHRAVQSLSALDARGLADIGVSRGEIEAVARTGRRGRGAVAWTDARPALPPAWTEWR
jgi:uncharacterized protein YjiS (DUF1127 family)